MNEAVPQWVIPVSLLIFCLLVGVPLICYWRSFCQQRRQAKKRRKSASKPTVITRVVYVKDKRPQASTVTEYATPTTPLIPPEQIV